MNAFKPLSVHWICRGRRIYLPQNLLSFLPRIGDEIRASAEDFYRVDKIVWCFDEHDGCTTRVNIEVDILFHSKHPK